jgi:hypothetical protein
MTEAIIGTNVMQKFPSIEQFRHVVRAVRDEAYLLESPYPTLKFTGSVKLHGTNAGISLFEDKIVYQSRNRILAPGDDNAGFVAHMSQHEGATRTMLESIVSKIAGSKDYRITVFGEWCGEGIQKGVALNQLPKMFVIFAIRYGEAWIKSSYAETNESARIFNINDFPTYEVEIDFNRPENAQNEMVKITEGVEAECPVGNSFGVKGIGEGVVWKVKRETGDAEDSSKYWFKVKGEKHSVSNVSTLAPVDVERMNCREDLLSSIITENRLDQGMHHFLNEDKLTLEMKNIGVFLRWVYTDAVKEESDTMVASGFAPKELGKPISDIAKRYFLRSMTIMDEMREAA